PDNLRMPRLTNERRRMAWDKTDSIHQPRPHAGSGGHRWRRTPGYLYGRDGEVDGEKARRRYSEREVMDPVWGRQRRIRRDALRDWFWFSRGASGGSQRRWQDGHLEQAVHMGSAADRCLVAARQIT